MATRYIPAKQWARNNRVSVSEQIRRRKSKRITVKRGKRLPMREPS